MATVPSMTQSQKLALRLSEIRQKLNELSAIEAPTDEQRSEMAALTAEYPVAEERSRAALTAEAADADARQAGGENANGHETGEGAEVRRLQGRARLGNYLTAAAGGAPLTGAESELLDALEVRGGVGVQPGAVQIPWSMLLADEPAPEARAATTTGEYGGPTMQRPILQRLFGPSLFDMLGVRLDTVPQGRSEWPLISAGVAPAMTQEDGNAPAAVAWTVGPQTLRPKRLTGRYEFTAEAAVSVIDLEQALRRDLADAVMSQASAHLLAGNYDATARPQQVTGFYARLAAPTDPTAESAYAEYASTPAAGVDGLHASMEDEVSVLLGTDTYRHAAGVFQAGSGEAGIEAIKRRCRTCMASVYVPDADGTSHISNSNIIHSGGPNGGAMRGDSIAAMWPTLNVIRDIYTQAAKAETVLTYIMLWDAYTAFRPAAYSRVAFQIEA